MFDTGHFALEGPGPYEGLRASYARLAIGDGFADAEIWRYR